ncbi:MAG: hypothetical protein AAGI01_14240 [Myxococcota bacterium]
MGATELEELATRGVQPPAALVELSDPARRLAGQTPRLCSEDDYSKARETLVPFKTKNLTGQPDVPVVQKPCVWAFLRTLTRATQGCDRAHSRRS